MPETAKTFENQARNGQAPLAATGATRLLVEDVAVRPGVPAKVNVRVHIPQSHARDEACNSADQKPDQNAAAE